MATPAASPLTSFFSISTAATFAIHCNGTIYSKDFATWCYTNTECNSYMQMSPTMTSHHFLVIPSSIPILSVRFGARTRFPTTLRTRSPLPSTHNSLCTPLQPLLGGLSCRFRLRSLLHADRMRKSHAARSSSRHRRFVTRVTIRAQLVAVTVRVAFFVSQHHASRSPTASGAYARGSTRTGVVFRFICAKI